MYAQNCGDVNFDSQAAVDTFVSNNNTSCNEIGLMDIRESNLDFSALTFINTIDKINIYAFFDDLTGVSFSGLENVTSLNEVNIIAYDPYEVTINSFQGLESITSLEKISIAGESGDAVIGSFQGLNNVTSITDFYINSSGSATSGYGSVNLQNGFNGLENLQTINKIFINELGSANINFNNLSPFQILSSLTTISELTTIGVNINFLGLENITSLEKLDLRELGSNFTDLNGFNGITQITDLSLYSNASLTALNGFDNLTNVVMGTIENNPNLTNCCIVGPFANNLNISNNATGCESVNVVLVNCLADADNDGINDEVDNCVLIPNPNQEDIDGNGIGDICEMDTDNDGVLDYYDNCINAANTTKEDYDNDGLGNVCDNDLDGDGIDNANDNCPYYANPDQADSDNDGIGDACENDYDNDTISDGLDNCPTAPNTNQADVNNNGIGDVCEDISGTGTGFFGIGTNNPQSKLHVSNGDIYIDNRHRGIIFKIPDGKCVRLRVTGTGTFNRRIVTCPDN